MNIKEILVLHHSHLDVGYTHSQAVITELQSEYIDQVLDFLDETAGRDERDRPKWSCEVTAPVLHWLKTASDRDVQRFEAYLREGRLGISAFEYNTTPLCSAEQLICQLQPARELEQRFNIRIRTLNQHDVNGIPWPMVDLMIDSGIEMLTMAVNQHLGRACAERPGIFRWQGPSGREIMVMNSNHYTMFDQHLLTWDNSIEKMKKGWEKLETHLQSINYPLDFIYLTTTNCPQMWDNSPPNMDVANLIQQWNAEGYEPIIRYVTPEELHHRIQSIDKEQIPVHRGDWTDFWNFGCASTTSETALNQNTRTLTATADFLNAFTAPGLWKDRRERALQRAWKNLNLYAEHTWCCAEPKPGSHIFDVTSQQQKNYALTAREESFYALTSALEEHASNAPQSPRRNYVLLTNPGPLPQIFHPQIPESWRKKGKRLRTNQMQTGADRELFNDGEYCTAIELSPYSWKKIELDQLTPIGKQVGIDAGVDDKIIERRGLNQEALDQEHQSTGWIESPFHRLTYHPVTGRILSLTDKHTGNQILDRNSKFGFFEFVRERADSMIDDARTAMYYRDLEKEKFDVSCWQHDWQPIRERGYRPVRCEIQEDAISRTLVRTYEAPGVDQLEQRIRLRVDSSIIELEVSFIKQACQEPESIYFAFPLNMKSGWDCHFDTAGTPVALDQDQLPGVSRDWFTVDSYVNLNQGNSSYTLLSPDTPMVQAGGFNFCKESESIPRQENPLLLSWACNNYWDTNFPLVQPGPVKLRYGIVTGNTYDPLLIHQCSTAFRAPAFAYPSCSIEDGAAGRFLSLEGNVILQYVKSVQDGVLVRLANLYQSEQPVVLDWESPITGAWLCSPCGEQIEEISCLDNSLRISLAGNRTYTILLQTVGRFLRRPIFR